MNNWLDLSDNANTFMSTIVDGFVDTSGGNIIVRENQHLEISGDASFNQRGSFAIPTLKTDVIDTTGLVELALSKIEFVEEPSFSQYAYDISGAESGGLAGHSISTSASGDIIAVGAPLNSGGGTARGEVRVYQKDNNSWLQLGNDLNGAADNDEFGHSVDLNGDGTILSVGTKNATQKTAVYKYASGSWSQYGNTIENNVSYESPSITGDPELTTMGCDYYWDFRTANTESSSVTDLIGGSNEATYNNGVTSNSTDGASFNAASRMNIKTDSITVSSTSLSLEMYVEFTSSVSWARILDVPTNQIYLRRQSSNSYFNLALPNNWSNNNGGVIVVDAWTHIVIVCSNNGTNMYQDNSLVISASEVISNFTEQFTLGGTADGSNYCFTGNMKYFRIFKDTELTTTQINTLYNNRETINFGLSPSTISATVTSASTKPKLNKTGDKLSILSKQHFDDLSGNGQVQSYEYSESDASWNYLGNKIESSAFKDISGGDIAINDEGNMITIGYPQSKSSIQGTYSYSVIAGSVFEFYGEEFSSDTANPVLTFKRGSTYNLTISTGGSHPFYIQTTDNGGSYDSANVYNNGVTNNGTGSGTITFVVPSDAPDTLYYVCQYHGNMGNSISIVNESGNDGRTKVFKYDTTDSSWNQVGNNIDGEGQAGTAIVIDGSGDFVAIGSPNVNAGEVNVYQNVADTWTLHGNKIEGQADNDQFGTSLDMTPAGNILAVGAPNANAGKGNVNIYQYNTTDTSWNKVGGDLSGDAVGDLTGTSVKLNELGTEVSVGEPTSNFVLPQAHSNATLFWNFAQNITTSTIGGDSGTEGTFRGDDGVGDDEVMTVTLTESEGFQSIVDSSEQLRVTSKNYVFPSDTFTIEFYVNVINLDETYPKIFDYIQTSGSNNGRFMINKDNNTTSLRMKIWSDTGTNYQKTFNIGIDWQFETWYHAVFVCDMTNGPTVSMYRNGVLAQTQIWPTNSWNREPGFDRELGVSTNYAYKSSAPNQNMKRFQIIDGLLDATEVAALYDNREAQASSFGGARTFEIEHTKFYNGMTNPTFGIGVTNPTNRLDVDGTVYIDGKLQTNDLSQNSGTTTVSGDLTLNGSISVSSVNNSSLTYDTDMSVNLLKRLFVNPNDISSYGETTQTHASDVVDTSVLGYYSQFGGDILGEGGTTGTADDALGESIAISGNGEVLFVGAKYNDETGNNEGKVYVYRHNGTDWALDSTITDPNDTSVMSLYLGEQVATNYYGTRVLVGCSGYSTSTSTYSNSYFNGIYKVFEQSTAGGSWNKIGNDFNQGTIRFQRQGYYPIGMNHNTDSSIDGKYVITGTYGGSSDGSVPWRAYEYDDSDWIQRGTDPIRDDSTGYHYLGVSQKINNDGTVIIVGNTYTNGGSYGSIHAYVWNGSDWQPKGSVIEYPYSDSGAYFGNQVAINGDGTIIATSAALSNEYAVSFGAVFVYQFINGDWVQLGNDIYGKSIIEYPGYYGLSLNNAGNRIVFGAYQNDDAGDDAGCIRIYEYVQNDWKQMDDDFLGPISANNETDVNFGYSVSMSYDGSKVAASAPNYHGLANSDTGLIRVYNYNSTVTSQTFSEDLSFNHSLVVPGNLVIVDGSNNTNYGSYTTYTSTDVDNYAATPTNKSYHVGKSKSNIFNIVNQDNIGVYMNTGDTSFTSTSDERLKHKIQHTENSLEKICALQPRKFKWKYNDKPESGFIAQEIEKVFPEMVDENNLPDGKTIKGVNHSSLLPYILDSLQSLDKEIDNLIDE